MTIAIGLRANDGIVLCADTQHTVSGYIKTYDGKVDVNIFREPFLAFALAGAGTDDYIKTAKQALMSAFPEECNTMVAVESILRERWLKFFSEQLGPWASFAERDRPSVELLIAATGHKLYPKMFYCGGTAFHETSQKAIGSGILLADELIGRYCFGNYTVAQLSSLAIHIIGKVKRGVDGCGGSTHIMGIRKNWDFAFVKDDDISALEKEFSDWEKSADKELVDKIVNKPTPLSWHRDHAKKKAAMTGKIPTAEKPQIR